MANYRIINFDGTVTADELFDDNGKIKSDLIPGGTVTYTSIQCTNAANTPQGITWSDGTTTITGTLVASENTQNNVYFVKNGENYDQYMTFVDGSSYTWVKVGTTLINNVSGMTYTVVQ